VFALKYDVCAGYTAHNLAKSWTRCQFVQRELAVDELRCTFFVVVDPGNNSSGPGAITSGAPRLRLVGLDNTHSDASRRETPVIRTRIEGYTPGQSAGASSNNLSRSASQASRNDAARSDSSRSDSARSSSSTRRASSTDLRSGPTSNTRPVPRELHRGADVVDINLQAVAREMRLASHAIISTTLSASAIARAATHTTSTAANLLAEANPADAEANAANAEAIAPTIARPPTTPRDINKAKRLVAGTLPTQQRGIISPLAHKPERTHAHKNEHAHQLEGTSKPDEIVEAADVRLRFAGEVVRNIEGGKAAILRPERRAKLVAAAVREGILPFDANLVMALIQDSARRGDLNTSASTNTPAPYRSPLMLQSDFEVNQHDTAYDAGIRRHLEAVVASTRVASMLPLVRVQTATGTQSVASVGILTPWIQAMLAAGLAGLLLVGMIASMGS